MTLCSPNRPNDLLKKKFCHLTVAFFDISQCCFVKKTKIYHDSEILILAYWHSLIFELFLPKIYTAHEQ